MSWVRVDDKIAFHRKVVKVGNEAFGAWMRMTTWSADHLSDGVVPTAIAWVIVGHGRESVIEALLEAGLLERSGDDFAVHDYHDHNPLAADVRAARDEASEAKRRAGAAGGRVSGAVRRSRNEAETKQTASASEEKPKQNGSETKPPSQSPSPKRKKNVQRSVGPTRFDSMYERYPRHEGRADGMETLEISIVTDEDFQRLERAVTTYAAKIARERPEKRHVLMWSTFANGRWLDYADPIGLLPGITTKSPAQLLAEEAKAARLAEFEGQP